MALAKSIFLMFSCSIKRRAGFWKLAIVIKAWIHAVKEIFDVIVVDIHVTNADPELTLYFQLLIAFFEIWCFNVHIVKKAHNDWTYSQMLYQSILVQASTTRQSTPSYLRAALTDIFFELQDIFCLKNDRILLRDLLGSQAISLTRSNSRTSISLSPVATLCGETFIQGIAPISFR